MGGTQLIEWPHTSLHQPTEPVCCGRRQLAEKEKALAAASDKLADIDSHMHSLAAKYDKTLARLAEDRKAVAMEEAERDAEESTVEGTRAQAAAAEAAAEEQQAKFDEQANLLGCCYGKHVTTLMHGLWLHRPVVIPSHCLLSQPASRRGRKVMTPCQYFIITDPQSLVLVGEHCWSVKTESCQRGRHFASSP